MKFIKVDDIFNFKKKIINNVKYNRKVGILDRVGYKVMIERVFRNRYRQQCLVTYVLAMRVSDIRLFEIPKRLKKLSETQKQWCGFKIILRDRPAKEKDEILRMIEKK
jgi:hypothetical protein